MASVQVVNLMDEVLDFLTSSPTPQQIIDFRASNEAQERMSFLLERNRKGDLSDAEKDEMEEISKLNHVMILLKARARS
jgi:hypothetical protein